jgi:tRNA-5-methyluridine54 2-sulfurtransferase
MRCRKCGQKAAINLRQHRLSLCKTHFLEWLPEQTLLQIKKYGMIHANERVLVAVSGGKDSLTLWDILNKLGIQADGLYIHLGIEGQDDYSNKSGLHAEEFAQNRGLTLHVADLGRQYGKTIPQLISRNDYSSQKPCSVCGLAKRHIMNSFALDNGYDCIATGHNLDDEASVLFSNTLNWSMERIQRQFPILPASAGLVRKVKPLNHFYERETTAYALLSEIQYIQEECPFSTGNLTNINKEFLNQLENAHPGTKMSFYVSFLKAKKDGYFAASELKPDFSEDHFCPNCGQLTTAQNRCSFCKLFSA